MYVLPLLIHSKAHLDIVVLSDSSLSLKRGELRNPQSLSELEN